MGAFKRNVKNFFKTLKEKIHTFNKKLGKIRPETNLISSPTQQSPVPRSPSNAGSLKNKRRWWQRKSKKPIVISKDQQRAIIMHNIQQLNAFRNELIDLQLKNWFGGNSAYNVDWPQPTPEEKVLERIDKIIWENLQALNATYADEQQPSDQTEAMLSNLQGDNQTEESELEFWPEEKLVSEEDDDDFGLNMLFGEADIQTIASVTVGYDAAR